SRDWSSDVCSSDLPRKPAKTVRDQVKDKVVAALKMGLMAYQRKMLSMPPVGSSTKATAAVSTTTSMTVVRGWPQYCRYNWLVTTAAASRLRATPQRNNKGCSPVMAMKKTEVKNQER